MKAFWWFKTNLTAGMARPGFNSINWFDLDFEEALIYGWLGQRSSDCHNIESLFFHINNFGPKIIQFHEVNKLDFEKMKEKLTDLSYLNKIFSQIHHKTKAIDQYHLNPNEISFTLNKDRLDFEINFLKKQKIDTIVTLTEKHNQKEELEEHFDLHHLAIDDLTPPSVEQALKLAEIIKDNSTSDRRTVVHCMAGIGRTSAMLMAAHIILGDQYTNLKSLLELQNPNFKFTGSQHDFIINVAKTFSKEE